MGSDEPTRAYRVLIYKNVYTWYYSVSKCNRPRTRSSRGRGTVQNLETSRCVTEAGHAVVGTLSKREYSLPEAWRKRKMSLPEQYPGVDAERNEP